MEPNLKAFNVAYLTFNATVPLSLEQVSKIRDAAHPDSDGDSAFFGSYEGHSSLAVVKRINKNKKAYEVEFAYVSRNRGKVDQNNPQIKQLIEILSSVQDQLNFECVVTFNFGRKLHPKSIISLPNKYIESPNMPFDRIQGVHLIKLDADKVKYDVFLEAPAQGILGENIIFKHSSKFQESLSDAIFQEAKTISDKIVFLGIKNA